MLFLWQKLALRYTIINIIAYLTANYPCHKLLFGRFAPKITIKVRAAFVRPYL